MQTFNIKLSIPESVKQFVNVVNSFTCDADLRSGRYVVDAKSILGIFSLDLTSTLQLTVYDKEAGNYKEKLKPFLV